ncbi:MAG: F0F1 ATP synthase subunit alpha [Clostridia bacterium]|nr:F0F1 ATP synthase subunit alpha [Clostridia bacterium]
MNKKTAVLYSDIAPDSVQEKRFIEFFREKYHNDYELIWKHDASIIKGFRLEIESDVYDWSGEGMLRQLKSAIRSVSSKENIVPLLKDKFEGWIPEAVAEEIGRVKYVGDGIAYVDGLENAGYGEILVFESGARGMVQELRENEVGCILFDEDESVIEGSVVKRTGKTAGIPVGENFIGRVIDSLGKPIDGAGEIKESDYLPIENPAPGIVERKPVDSPVQTGLLVIDSMFPIGKGQRELIIGDRQTGKTAIAVDTIINQKGKNVICIYVAVGQKSSSVAALVTKLKKFGAMDYTIVVNASASDPAPLQYIAPYSGCSLGEYFMNKGRDVLIIYDDLSKHAAAYRTMSLLLERSPGREAYPGDVFYLHSRLLERSACLSDERGGGSMTALPIVETQSGDVSAYIPTNIISITDGQIFLESSLFFEGQRPAVNIGLSVSRVGGAAQTKAMKKASGTIKLDLSQFKEMEVFMQFSSDLDEASVRQLKYGQVLTYMLRQPQYKPMPVHRQVITLVAALSKVLNDIPLEKLNEKINEMNEWFENNHSEITSAIEQSGTLSDEDRDSIISLAEEFVRL